MTALIHALLVPAAYAATTTVNSLADTQANDGQCTLREAIINANNDDQSGSIDCVAGSGVDTIDFNVSGIILLGSALPDITQDIILDGAGQTVRVDGQNTVRVFNITAANAIIRNLTVQNGNTAGTGGGINAARDMSLSNVVILDNVATNNGGGVAAAGLLTILDSRFDFNHSDTSGGGVNASATLSITNTTFVANNAGNSGGAAAAGGTVTLTGSHFEDNFCVNAGCDGGGLRGFSNLTITHTDFISNNALDVGGGIAMDGVITMLGGSFERNRASHGGGLFAATGLIISGTVFITNTALNILTTVIKGHFQKSEI